MLTLKTIQANSHIGELLWKHQSAVKKSTHWFNQI